MTGGENDWGRSLQGGEGGVSFGSYSTQLPKMAAPLSPLSPLSPGSPGPRCPHTHFWAHCHLFSCPLTTFKLPCPP